MGFCLDAGASRQLIEMRSLLPLILACLAFAGPASASDSMTVEKLCELVATAAKQQPSAQDATPIELATDDGSVARVTLRPPSSGWRMAIAQLEDRQGSPALQARIMPPCKLIEARRLQRDTTGAVAAVEILENDLATVRNTEPVNPPVPELAAGNARVRLAHVDTGVNYLLPDVRERLASDASGRLLGYDFWDDDDRPFDIDARRNIFLPLHHGTTVFSVLARESGDEPIAVYRFPAPDMCRFANLVSHMAALGVRVVNMSMGSFEPADWDCFASAAAKHPDMLFVVSAGNDGRDLDQAPVYPAALPLENMVTVTSSDDFGRIGRGSNVGAGTVDIMVPAERVGVFDHRGVRAETGGTSYAAPRVAGLAMRFLAANPEASTADIIAFLVSRTRLASSAPLVHGWIPDPSDDFGF